jgi:citrate lyase subunit beta/citryl-CoA lyase
MVSPRSWLFCPGQRTDRLAKAVAIADVAVADLEDAVPLAAKGQARDAVVEWLRANPETAPRVWVRINNDELHREDDLAALAGLPLGGIVVPKAELDVVHEVAGRAGVALLALVETATGLWQLRELAAADRVHSLTLGEYDLAVDLGAASPEVDAEPLAWARAQVVAAAAAARLAPPPAPVSARLDAPEAFTEDTAALLRRGFFGRMCIHPTQVALTHAAMTPGAQEVAEARRVVRAAEEAERQGIGVLVVDGRMVDAPIVLRARRVLELAADG